MMTSSALPADVTMHVSFPALALSLFDAFAAMVMPSTFCLDAMALGGLSWDTRVLTCKDPTAMEDKQDGEQTEAEEGAADNQRHVHPEVVHHEDAAVRQPQHGNPEKLGDGNAREDSAADACHCPDGSCFSWTLGGQECVGQVNAELN
eukprot:401060-Hanusia_phi.AAC.1